MKDSPILQTIDPNMLERAVSQEVACPRMTISQEDWPRLFCGLPSYFNDRVLIARKGMKNNEASLLGGVMAMREVVADCFSDPRYLPALGNVLFRYLREGNKYGFLPPDLPSASSAIDAEKDGTQEKDGKVGEPVRQPAKEEIDLLARQIVNDQRLQTADNRDEDGNIILTDSEKEKINVLASDILIAAEAQGCSKETVIEAARNNKAFSAEVDRSGGMLDAWAQNMANSVEKIIIARNETQGKKNDKTVEQQEKPHAEKAAMPEDEEIAEYLRLPEEQIVKSRACNRLAVERTSIPLQIAPGSRNKISRALTEMSGEEVEKALSNMIEKSGRCPLLLEELRKVYNQAVESFQDRYYLASPAVGISPKSPEFRFVKSLAKIPESYKLRQAAAFVAEKISQNTKWEYKINEDIYSEKVCRILPTNVAHAPKSRMSDEDFHAKVAEIEMEWANADAYANAAIAKIHESNPKDRGQAIGGALAAALSSGREKQSLQERKSALFGKPFRINSVGRNPESVAPIFANMYGHILQAFDYADPELLSNATYPYVMDRKICSKKCINSGINVSGRSRFCNDKDFEPHTKWQPNRFAGTPTPDQQGAAGTQEMREGRNPVSKKDDPVQSNNKIRGGH